MNHFLNLFFFLSFTVTQLSAIQESDKKKISNQNIFLISCNHPVVNKAKEEGLIALKWKEIPTFIFVNIKCQIQARKSHIKLEKSNLFKNKQIYQHELNKKISGPGTLIASVSSLILFYTYLRLIANSPNELTN